MHSEDQLEATSWPIEFAMEQAESSNFGGKAPSVKLSIGLGTSAMREPSVASKA